MVLVGLAVATPWAFGAVGTRPLRFVIVTGLLAAAGALVLAALGGGEGPGFPAVASRPMAVFLAVVAAQLLPLPAAAQRVLAPGAWAVWRPAETAADVVLGAGPRPLSIDPETTLSGLALLAGLTLLTLLAAPALTERRFLLGALGITALAGSVLSIYAILARDRFGPLLYGRLAVPTVRPFGPFVNENHFAGWTAMAALLAAGLATGIAEDARRHGRDWTTGRRAALVAAAMVASLVMALAVLASLSRGGSLALVVGAACLLALVLGRRHRRAQPLAVASAIALVLLLGLLVVTLAPGSARARLGSTSGASFRLDTWRDALRLAASSPLIGCGLGAFHDAYPRFKRDHASVRVEHAENDYLETLAETGLAGLLPALAGLILLFRSAVAGVGGGQDAIARGAHRGALAALAALAVHSAFDFDLRIPSNAVLAGLALSTALAGTRTHRVGRVAAAALALAAVLLAVGVLMQTERPWLRTREEVRRAFAAPAGPARELRLARADAALVALLRERPAHAESWLALAAVRRAEGDLGPVAALARRAVWLDPERPGLAERARQLGGGPPGTP